MRTQYSLDDGVTWHDAKDNVRISIIEDAPSENTVQLDFNFTAEGLITDLWEIRDGGDDENLATRSSTFDEIIEDLTQA